MSRLAKKPVQLPEKTSATYADGVITITGPLGSLSRTFSTDGVMIAVEGNTVTISAKNTEVVDPIVGTVASHIRNMVAGVNKAFEEKLQIEGIGYKAEVKGDKIVLSLGFSHQVPVEIPKTLKVTVDKNIITTSGINKEEVSQFAAQIRALKKPEPYKGKGIMYVGEVIRRKQGKKAA